MVRSDAFDEGCAALVLMFRTLVEILGGVLGNFVMVLAERPVVDLALAVFLAFRYSLAIWQYPRAVNRLITRAVMATFLPTQSRCAGK